MISIKIKYCTPLIIEKCQKNNGHLIIAPPISDQWG